VAVMVPRRPACCVLVRGRLDGPVLAIPHRGPSLAMRHAGRAVPQAQPAARALSVRPSILPPITGAAGDRTMAGLDAPLAGSRHIGSRPILGYGGEARGAFAGAVRGKPVPRTVIGL
jgi:hypothetical protein